MVSTTSYTTSQVTKDPSQVTKDQGMGIGDEYEGSLSSFDPKAIIEGLNYPAHQRASNVPPPLTNVTPLSASFTEQADIIPLSASFTEQTEPKDPAHPYLRGKYADTFKWDIFEGGLSGAWKALKDDNYVRSQWSANYYADTLSAGFDGLKGSVTHWDKIDGTFFKVVGKAFWHVEVANFFKGLLGIFGTLPILGKHALLTVFYVAGLCLSPIICLGLLACKDKQSAKEFLKEAGLGFVSNLAHIFKDFATMIASAGHMVAFWVPTIIALLPIPGSSALAAVVFAAMLKGFASLNSMPGVFDIMGNTGTGLLLNMEKAFLKWEMKTEENQDKLNDLNIKLGELEKDYKRLKDELDPTTFGGYMTCVMMLSSIVGFALHHIPVIGPLVASLAQTLPSEIPTTFLCEWGLAAVPAAVLAAGVKGYRYYKGKSIEDLIHSSKDFLTPENRIKVQEERARLGDDPDAPMLVSTLITALIREQLIDGGFSADKARVAAEEANQKKADEREIERLRTIVSKEEEEETASEIARLRALQRPYEKPFPKVQEQVS